MPDFRDESIKLQHLIFRVFNQLKKEADSIFNRHGLTGAQIGVLSRLRGTEGKSMGMLGRELWCDVSNITGIIDRLEKHGLVERAARPGDRRVKIVKITRKGSDALSEILPESEEALKHRMMRLGSDERVEFARLLETISD